MDLAMYNILESNKKPRFRGNKRYRAPLAGYKDHPSIPWEMKKDFTPSACTNCSDVKDSVLQHVTGTRNALLEKPHVSSIFELHYLLKLHQQVRCVQVSDGQLEALKACLGTLQDGTTIFVVESFGELDRAVLWRVFNLCGLLPILVEEDTTSWEHRLFECSQDIREGHPNVVNLESRRNSRRLLEKLAHLRSVSLVPVSLAWDICDLTGKRTARVNFGHPVTLEDFQQNYLANQLGKDLWGFIEAHLRYGIEHNRPIMPTSLMALMKHFGITGPETCGKQTQSLFQGLVYDIRNRGYDLGFTGKTEHVLQYSSTVVERSWNRINRFGTAWDAAAPFLCDALMVTAVLSILGGCLVSDEEPELRQNELTDVFKELLELFKYEAQLVPPCCKEDQRFANTLHCFVQNGVLSYKKEEEMEETEDERRARRIARHLDCEDDDDDDLFYRQPAQAKAPEVTLFVNKENLRRYWWMRKIWAPIIDAYYETALTLLRLVETDVMEDEDFVRLVTEEIRSKLRKDLLQFEESASTVFVRNALRFFQDIEIVDSFTHSGITVLYLQPLAKQAEVIFDLAAQIGKFKE